MAFVATPALPSQTAPARKATCPRMSAITADAQAVVDKYYPPWQRNRAPTIVFNGEESISFSMAPVKAFVETDKTDDLLFDYLGEDVFVPKKPVPPSPISWPGGDGRGNPLKSRKSFFEQPNLKIYGPFEDFYKRSCDG